MQGNSRIYLIGAIVIVVALLFYFMSGSDEVATDTAEPAAEAVTDAPAADPAVDAAAEPAPAN